MDAFLRALYTSLLFSSSVWWSFRWEVKDWNSQQFGDLWWFQPSTSQRRDQAIFVCRRAKCFCSFCCGAICHLLLTQTAKLSSCAYILPMKRMQKSYSVCLVFCLSFCSLPICTTLSMVLRRSRTPSPAVCCTCNEWWFLTWTPAQAVQIAEWSDIITHKCWSASSVTTVTMIMHTSGQAADPSFSLKAMSSLACLGINVVLRWRTLMHTNCIKLSFIGYCECMCAW